MKHSFLTFLLALSFLLGNASISLATQPVKNFVNKVVNFDTTFLNEVYRPYQAAKQRRRFKQFTIKVDQSSPHISQTQFKRPKIKAKQLDIGKDGLMHRSQMAEKLLGKVSDVRLKTLDISTGKRVAITQNKLDEAKQTLHLFNDWLQQNPAFRASITKQKIGIDEVLARPDVAKALKTHAKATQDSFMPRYYESIETLKGLNEAYFVRDMALAGVDANVSVAFRRMTPKKIQQNVSLLSKEVFGGNTHLWVDDIMKAKAGADDHYRKLAKNTFFEVSAEGKQLKVPVSHYFEPIIKYRDNELFEVFAHRAGKADTQLQASLKPQIKDLGLDTGRQSMLTAHYGGVTDLEGFLPAIGMGTLVGGAVDASPISGVLKPTIMGGIDDGVGGYFNYKELDELANAERIKLPSSVSAKLGERTSAVPTMPNNPKMTPKKVDKNKKYEIERVVHQSGDETRVLKDQAERAKAKGLAKKQFAIALSFGMGTSLFVAAPIYDEGESIASRFLDFEDRGEQMTAAALMGLLSSGSSIAFPMLLYPAALKNTQQLIKNRMVLHPMSKAGKPLSGSSLSMWQRGQAVKSIVSYPAQGGGVAGAGFSMVVAPAYSLFGGAPAVAQNAMISFIGSAETVATGLSIGGRTSFGYKAAKKTIDRKLPRLTKDFAFPKLKASQPKPLIPAN